MESNSNLALFSPMSKESPGFLVSPFIFMERKPSFGFFFQSFYCIKIFFGHIGEDH